MEGVLTANYNRFAPIREGKYYWSSATGKDVDLWLYVSDDDNRARATAAYIDNGNIVYAPSDKGKNYEVTTGTTYNGKAGGSAKRTEKLRIRAIYHPDNGDTIDGYTYRNNASQDIATFITNYPQ